MEKAVTTHAMTEAAEIVELLRAHKPVDCVRQIDVSRNGLRELKTSSDILTAFEQDAAVVRDALKNDDWDREYVAKIKAAFERIYEIAWRYEDMRNS